MVGAIFTLYLLAGIWSAYTSGRVADAALASVWSGLIGTVLWFAAVMLTYYAFFGTAQQEYVLNLENHDDFVRSGMTDFRAFILQDFMGACFFISSSAPYSRPCSAAWAAPWESLRAVSGSESRERSEQLLVQ